MLSSGTDLKIFKWLSQTKCKYVFKFPRSFFPLKAFLRYYGSFSDVALIISDKYKMIGQDIVDLLKTGLCFKVLTMLE